jgi:hypothetical protein
LSQFANDGGTQINKKHKETLQVPLHELKWSKITKPSDE